MVVRDAVREVRGSPERRIETIRRRFADAGLRLELAPTEGGDWQARCVRIRDRRVAGALVGATRLAAAEIALAVLEAGDEAT